MSFDGRTVWITGGGSGIGKALALELAGRGAAVAVSGRRADKIEAVAEEIRSKGGQSIALACDVTDEATVHDTAERVAEELGGIDVVIANAGFGVAGRFEKLSLDEWRRQMDVNVIGLVSTVKEALPHIKERRGSVVLLGSVAAFLPVTGNIAYNASKAAVASIGSTLSAELHGTGVTVTTIHPGFVESEIAQVDNEGRHDASRKDPRPEKLMWTAEKAAKVCATAIAKRKREFVFTGHGKVAAFLGRHTPSIAQRMFTSQSAKKQTAKR